jgi:hypothetical protein
MQNKPLQDIKKKIIQFDSCTAMVNALSLYLKGEEFVGVGIKPQLPPWIGNVIGSLPENLRQQIYRWSGWLEALPADKVHNLKTEDIAQWIVMKYPPQKYPAMMFGSSNGAMVHLGAAIQAPWLPQTFLIAIRRDLHPDEIKKDIAWGKNVIRPILKNNPKLFAHQMHDPLQDRLMIEKMGYFRIKFISWEEQYQQFVKNHLQHQAPLISIECRYLWPAYRVQERHYFQLGGFGGLDAYEYLEGGKRVDDFLRYVESPVSRWESYTPTEKLPEAEWGFLEDVFIEVKTFAQKNEIPLYRLIFDHPEHLSPFVADLYQWWYQKRGIRANKILLESFGLLEPYWTIHSHAIPLWLAFNTLGSADLAEDYIRKHSFEKIFLMLMSNGVKEGIGLTKIDRWREILKLGKTSGDFIGVDEKLYPLDFGIFLKYHEDLKNKLKKYDNIPEPLSFGELREFIDQSLDQYLIRWEKVSPG